MSNLIGERPGVSRPVVAATAWQSNLIGERLGVSRPVVAAMAWQSNPSPPTG
jgi:hypothetical protein